MFSKLYFFSFIIYMLRLMQILCKTDQFWVIHPSEFLILRQNKVSDVNEFSRLSIRLVPFARKSRCLHNCLQMKFVFYIISYPIFVWINHKDVFKSDNNSAMLRKEIVQSCDTQTPRVIVTSCWYTIFDSKLIISYYYVYFIICAYLFSA